MTEQISLSELTEEEIKQDVLEIIKLENQVNEFIDSFNQRYIKHGIGLSLSLDLGKTNRIHHSLLVSSMTCDKNANLFTDYFEELRKQ